MSRTYSAARAKNVISYREYAIERASRLYVPRCRSYNLRYPGERFDRRPILSPSASASPRINASLRVPNECADREEIPFSRGRLTVNGRYVLSRVGVARVIVRGTDARIYSIRDESRAVSTSIARHYISSERGTR